MRRLQERIPLSIREKLSSSSHLCFSNSNWRLFVDCVLLPLAAFTTVGCGSPSDTISVNGKVSYRGEPLTNGSVTFFPQSGRPASAPLANEGHYQIELPPGTYQVTITVGLTVPEGWKEGDQVAPAKFILPPQYTTRAKSNLTAEIAEGSSQSVDFALK
jgi:hypothetical protein